KWKYPFSERRHRRWLQADISESDSENEHHHNHCDSDHIAWMIHPSDSDSVPSGLPAGISSDSLSSYSSDKENVLDIIT
ncbi:hypothetical protein SK128_008430, partial [Halocaridina rubra]